jgi:protein gp37
MAENTKIEWAHHTFNPWEGCQKVGPGCDNCYAEARNARFSGGHAVNWGPGAPRRRTSEANWKLPLKWNAQAAAEGRRFRVFCASLADVFDNEVPPEWRRDVLRLILNTPHLDWLLLTKRIGNAAAMLEEASQAIDGVGWQRHPWSNVWLGATVVNQTEADRDIPKLLAVPARVRFLSIEPMLGPIDLTGIGRYTNSSQNIDALRGIDTRGVLAMSANEASSMVSSSLGGPRVHWVIAGGESGPHARPMHPDWARSLRDQCAAAGVPFLFKQWGEFSPAGDYEPYPGKRLMQSARVFIDVDRSGRQHHGPTVIRFGKKTTGRLLDGVEHNGFPEVSR